MRNLRRSQGLVLAHSWEVGKLDGNEHRNPINQSPLEMGSRCWRSVREEERAIDSIPRMIALIDCQWFDLRQIERPCLESSPTSPTSWFSRIANCSRSYEPSVFHLLRWAGAVHHMQACSKERYFSSQRKQKWYTELLRNTVPLQRQIFRVQLPKWRIILHHTSSKK